MVSFLYKQSEETARRNRELALYQESLCRNQECAAAIDEAILLYFDGMHLETDAITEVMDAFGVERVHWVLANTLQQIKDDTEINALTHVWANGFDIPQPESGSYLIAGASASVLDTYVRLARSDKILALYEHEKMSLLGQLEENKKAAGRQQTAPPRGDRRKERV